MLLLLLLQQLLLLFVLLILLLLLLLTSIVATSAASVTAAASLSAADFVTYTTADAAFVVVQLTQHQQLCTTKCYLMILFCGMGNISVMRSPFLWISGIFKFQTVQFWGFGKFFDLPNCLMIPNSKLLNYLETKTRSEHIKWRDNRNSAHPKLGTFRKFESPEVHFFPSGFGEGREFYECEYLVTVSRRVAQPTPAPHVKGIGRLVKNIPSHFSFFKATGSCSYQTARSKTQTATV